MKLVVLTLGWFYVSKYSISVFITPLYGRWRAIRWQCNSFGGLCWSRITDTKINGAFDPQALRYSHQHLSQPPRHSRKSNAIIEEEDGKRSSQPLAWRPPLLRKPMGQKNTHGVQVHSEFPVGPKSWVVLLGHVPEDCALCLLADYDKSQKIMSDRTKFQR